MTFQKAFLTVMLFGAACAPAIADEFSLPPSCELGEVAVDSLNLKDAGPAGELDPGVAEAMDPLKDYPLSQSELSLVFDAAAAPTGFGPRPTASESAGAFREMPVALKMRRAAAAEPASADPTEALSGTPEELAQTGVRVDLDPVEEEVILNWSVGF